MGDQIIVTITKWADFNYRKDITAPSWFRFAHKFFEDAQFYDFSHSEICAWLYVLCQASKESSSQILINLKHLEIVGRIRLKDFKSALQKLERNGIVTTALRGSTDACSTEQDKTRQNKTLQNSANASAFDLALIFEGYPKKEGESKGLRLLKSQIKTQKDFDDCLVAVSNYSRHCKTIEAKFIQKFHNWVGEWRDWLKPTTGKIKFAKPKPVDPVPLPTEPDPRVEGKGITPELQEQLNKIKAGKYVSEKAGA